MKQYLDLVQEVLSNGTEKKDRTGTGTISLFGVQKKYDLREGFPLVTTKKILLKSVISELLWFLTGSKNIKDMDCHIWDEWARPDGDVGPLYGYQWVKWDKYEAMDEEKGIYKKTHINQIQNAIDLIKKDPDSRRILVSAWNVSDLDKMALYPCHAFFQFYVKASAKSQDARRQGNFDHSVLTGTRGPRQAGPDNEADRPFAEASVVNGRLDCQLYQRSADIALGVPFNIASYSALMIMMAQECSLEPGIFTHTIGDAHIYLNHVEGLKEQLKRTPYALPQLKVAKKSIWEIKYEDFELLNYNCHPFIKFQVAV